MPVSRSNQGKSTAKPHALNSLKKPASKPSKTAARRSDKKSAGPTSVSSGYSLYSSGSESGGVSSINHGLDRCAALLANILDEEDGLDEASKMRPSKQTSTTRKPHKVKQMTKGVSKMSRQSQGVKKEMKQKQSTTSKHSGYPLTQSTKKLTVTVPRISRPRMTKLSEENPTRERRLPQVQATQFNDRLVSSTPEMGSPSSQHHNSGFATDGSNGIPNQQQLGIPQYQDSSLEALAAQIRMLRTQAEMAESAPKLPNPPTHKETEALHHDGISNRLEDPSVVNTSTVRREKIPNNGSEPGQILRSLTDHLRDLNKRHQATPAPNPITEHNQEPIQPQVQHQQASPARHQVHMQGLPKSHHLVTGEQFQTKSAPYVPTHRHDPCAQFEPPELVNTSFIPEYHQLPNQTIDITPSRERIFNQLKEIQIASTMPDVPHQHRHHQGVQNKTLINQQKVVNDTNSINHMHGHQMEANQSKPSHTGPSDLPQDTSRTRCGVEPQRLPAEKDLENESSRLAPDKIHTVCMGTQTFSPPADKGVQTSNLPSPTTPDVKASSDSDSSSDGQPRSGTQTIVTDTPRPLHMTSGKKSASWEQMRVLRYLVGELRAAIGDLGGDKEVGRLLTEIQECLDTLQYLPPDIQVEIGLALQPLRSENSQLRRRLRIANQQIRRLEKGPDKENMEPPVDVEVLTLQSLNAKLQKDLREEVNKQKKLTECNAQYKTATENMKQKHQDLMALLQQKDNHQLQSRQEWLEEKSALACQLDEMQLQLNDLEFKIAAINKENRILQLSLQQRDAEILRLKQDTESNFFEHRHQVYAQENDSTSEADDDDDVTPKASPHQSPHRPPPHHGDDGTSTAQDFHDFTVHHTARHHETNRLQNASAYNQTNPLSSAPQGFAKRVTFAQYLSPKQTHADYGSKMASRLSRTMTEDGYQEFPSHPDLGGTQLTKSANVVPVEESGRSNSTNSTNDTDLLHILPSEKADKEFSMRKFLQHSRHFGSDEDAVETDSSESIESKQSVERPLMSTTTNQRNIYSGTYNSTQPSHHSTTVHSPVEIHQSHNPVFQNRTLGSNIPGHQDDYSYRQSSQDGIFQGSVLDRSVSGIDSESTQSSVTSQYEAQFQLGLASLDSEIEKLQNSLKSIGAGKPIRDFDR